MRRRSRASTTKASPIALRRSRPRHIRNRKCERGSIDRIRSSFERNGAIIAFAAAQPSSLRACYARNAEFSVYVQRDMRGQGAGRVAMRALAEILREMKFNKLVSHIFADNEASLRMLRGIGFRVIGTLERHGDLEGRWRDVVVMEMLL